MPTTESSRAQRGIVVAHLADHEDHASEHERVTLREYARRLALLRGDDDGGVYERGRDYAAPLYFVPNRTLTAAEARALGIEGPDDLLGGVVPHAFVGSKAISHPLFDGAAASVDGWSEAVAAQVGDAVLAGYAAFSRADALRAGVQLLQAGPVRLKPVRASGGRGQEIAVDAASLRARVEAMDEAEIAAHGLVLEEDLRNVVTFSVGQVRIAGMVASYYGFQKLTRNNEGAEVYGGSDLAVVKGDFDALLTRCPTAELRLAVAQACRYDTAVHACFPGTFVTRSNYDILQGRDARGTWRSGVLEQSFRVGGATGCEIAALEAFAIDPERTLVHTCGVEVFGDSPEPPDHATVYFRGIDPRMGRLTKYTYLQADDDSRSNDRYRR